MDDNYLRPAEAAALAKVSRATVFRWIRRGALPCIRLYGVTLVRRSDLVAMIEAHASDGAA